MKILAKVLKIHTNNYGTEWPERRQRHQARWKFNKKLSVSSEMLVIWCWPSCSIFHLQQQQGCGAAFSRRFSRFARLARPRVALCAAPRVPSGCCTRSRLAAQPQRALHPLTTPKFNYYLLQTHLGIFNNFEDHRRTLLTWEMKARAVESRRDELFMAAFRSEILAWEIRKRFQFWRHEFSFSVFSFRTMLKPTDTLPWMMNEEWEPFLCQ